MNRETQRELHDLLSGLMDDTLDPTQQVRLGELLPRHAEARQLYLAYCDLHADLALRGDAGTFSRLSSVCTTAASSATGRQGDKETGRGKRGPAAPLSPLRLVSLSGLAAGVILLLVFWNRPDPAAEGVDDSVAMLVQAPQAEWDDSGARPEPGQALAPGWLRLRSGFAHVEFYSGATVILEAPAEFRLISRTEAFCARGKLRATVPEHARGFRIGTPNLDVVDRGQEFGLRVVGESEAEIHAIQGKVEVYDATARKDASAIRELTTGQGVRLDGPAGVRLIASEPDAFRTAEYVSARSDEENRRRYDGWLEVAKGLRQDPSLLVHYSFHELGGGAGGRPPADATVVGCSWGKGRWPGKPGLEFKRVGDRVRLHVPGTFGSVTLLAWLRVDALPNVNNALFMSDGWDAGGLHWQIGRYGKLVLGVKGPPGGPDGHYHARHVLRPDRLGQWVQLAVVYDGSEGRVTHYVDGRPAGATRIAADVPLRIGSAELGNWNSASRRERSPARWLNGCVDEFLAFSRALRDDEIERLYAQGRPPS